VEVVDIAFIPCGPFCESQDITLGPSTCTDNYSTNNYSYGTSEGTVSQIDGTVTIHAGTLSVGSHTVFVSCVCESLGCSSRVSYEFDICKKATPNWACFEEPEPAE